MQTPRETLKLFLGGNRDNSGSLQTLEKATITSSEFSKRRPSGWPQTPGTAAPIPTAARLSRSPEQTARSSQTVYPA
jgi:hypothetical protein